MVHGLFMSLVLKMNIQLNISSCFLARKCWLRYLISYYINCESLMVKEYGEDDLGPCIVTVLF